MVFLSAPAAGKREEDKHAQQLAFSNLGTYGDGDELLANKDKLPVFQWHGRFMIAKFQTKLRERDFLVNWNLELWKDLRILVTTEKFPWPYGQFPAINRFPCLNHHGHRKDYYKYLEFFEQCVNLFQKRMENVAMKLEKAYINLMLKFASGASLGDEPDMKTILTIISIEEHIWGEDQMKWAQPLSYTGNVIFLRYRDIRGGCSQLIHTQDQKYGGYTTHLHESPMDTTRQGTTNHGDLDSVVSGGVAKPIASNQQWPLFTSDGYAGTSHGSTYTDRSEFGYNGIEVGHFSITTTTMRHYADPYGYGISTECYHAYIGDDSSIEGTTSFAHPPTYAPADLFSPYPGGLILHILPPPMTLPVRLDMVPRIPQVALKGLSLM
ncbi:hypothetical protein SeMB42_g07517 [Synchytrium endobioticum]|uniref:Uncharacterized protein n=1 Tax=Synchytrium endobioticum TaxID=286115 RepID=A0A507C269_9FUNG|nr:hypothetical protein SeMB42_g07517 [Synchytrium endobioticum]